MKQLHTTIDQQVADETISTRKLLDLLSRKAIGVAANLMEGAESESVRLTAARDLMDRGSDTSKIQKHQIESFSISGEDAKDLARAMVEAAMVKERHAAARAGDYIKLDGGLADMLDE